MEIAVRAASDRQISLTDPDARAMATSGKGTDIVGYNVQTAVDVAHHLIVAHEVTNVCHDRTHLMPMGFRAQDATGNEEITVLVDRGYSTAIRYWHARTPACSSLASRPVIVKPSV
jgi:hypothetical protein